MTGILDDAYESDLTEEESEELLLLCGHGIGPKLSPAAQAVLDAAHDGANAVLFDIGDDSPVPMCAAAALRAAALYCKRDRLQLLAIAAELQD